MRSKSRLKPLRVWGLGSGIRGFGFRLRVGVYRFWSLGFGLWRNESGYQSLYCGHQSCSCLSMTWYSRVLHDLLGSMAVCVVILLGIVTVLLFLNSR